MALPRQIQRLIRRISLEFSRDSWFPQSLQPGGKFVNKNTPWIHASSPFQRGHIFHGVQSKTEMQGFEPWRRANGLKHFECLPFSLLGTSPNHVETIHAGNRGRTGMGCNSRRILSPVRLPVPPCRQGQLSLRQPLLSQRNNITKASL